MTGLHRNCPTCNSDSKRVMWNATGLFWVTCLVDYFKGPTATTEEGAWKAWDAFSKRPEDYRTDGS